MNEHNNNTTTHENIKIRKQYIIVYDAHWVKSKELQPAQNKQRL